MSIHLLNVLQCGLLIFAATATADLSSQQIDAIVRRHKDYAASKLTDPHHFISSSALDALATLSFDEHEGQLRECLTLPLSDPSLDVALAQLISRTRPSDLCRVQEIVVAAGKQGVLERTAEPFAANAAITESLALEVMLASRDCKAVQFATAYLVAMVQNNRGPGITQMDRALELIGQYELKSAAARIQLNSIDDALRVKALSALANNGQQSACDELKRRVAAMEGVGQIISDSKLVDRLALTPKELKSIYQRGDSTVRILSAGQLARKSSVDELLAIIQSTRSQLGHESALLVGQMIGQHGDASLIDDLDKLAQKEHTAVGRLTLLRDLFQLIRRTQVMRKE